MRLPQRTGTTHPARPVDHFFSKKKSTIQLKLNTSHHILIPSSDTHNHKPYQPYNTTHSSSYAHLLNKTLLVLFKCIEIVAIRILHPCQIQQRPNYVPPRLHWIIQGLATKVQKHGHTQEEKGLTINEQCTTIATTLGKEIVTEKPPVTPQRDLGHETSVTHLPEPVTNIQQTLDHNHTNCYKP